MESPGVERERSCAPKRRAVISLLTDFGLQDAYVGAMKGVLARLAPEALVVDICHEIPPQDILRAGVVWAAAVPYFPRGTVHVAVVDPGVGTRRKILAVEARGCVFLAPDNGILGYVLRRGEVRGVYEVRRRSLFLSPVSRTFHGRDIFAPVAAALARGLPASGLGPPCRPAAWGVLPRTRARWQAGRRWLEERGEILTFDRFGNAMTNLKVRPGFRIERFRVGSIEIRRLSRAYGDALPGAPLLCQGSSGYLEVAVNRGSAERELSLKRGQTVVAAWRRRGSQSGPTG